MPPWMHLPPACRFWNGAVASRAGGRRHGRRRDHVPETVRGSAALLESLTCLPVPDDDGLEAAPRGCGWFDSSHELQAGLQVLEHAVPDAVARELPVGAWLELYLGLRGGGALASAVD